MAQFDVYKNPSKNTRHAYPYIVDIQSPLIAEFSNQNCHPARMKVLTPELSYEDEPLLLLTPQIASVPSKALIKPVGSLNSFRDEIVAALDFSITGI